MSWAWLAIVVGVLIVVTRAPLIFRPPETLALYRRLWATNARTRGLGALYAGLALACFWGAVGASGITLQIFVLLGALLLAITVWLVAAPGHFRGFADGIFAFVEESIDTAALRGICILAVGVGGLMIYAGARSL